MDAPTDRRARTPRSTGTDLALVAGFAAIIAVCALLPAIKLAGPVPITLQTFGVLLSGAVLGARRGLLAVLLYLAVGAAGLPVFSGGAAGLGVLAGPTAGYLVGFPVAAALCGLLVERLPRRLVRQSVPAIFAAGLLSSAVAIHTLGMAGLVWRAGMTWSQAFGVDAAFWIGDVVKNVAMAVVATAVHRAFPDLLARRAPARQPQPA
ncbi:biotin transporter BioY [Auraticoccus sp. F435]|uniref:Biotin transporter n=1 Tax=Auraticoccus cholistanensis TaxID=2656650 RepID=A0A6A9UTX5_9ACTN|nr:biotin transporter BioY [Auraticoccus cholistanensis]MVA76118.1 biotin transporter BioY [Auraticoccus cholistanensis]